MKKILATTIDDYGDLQSEDNEDNNELENDNETKRGNNICQIFKSSLSNSDSRIVYKIYIFINIKFIIK